ncbi:MAG TPA: DUF4136 domain-containing protein [Sphingomicrobium sp.]
MRLQKFAAAALLGVAALGLSACASSITSTVSRYQAMPAPQGQTFFVVPGGGMASNGGLEFQRYAGLVAQQLQARGYAPAASQQTASMVVQLGYGIDQGQVRYVEDPFYRSRYGYGGFYDPFYSPYRGFYYPRFGYRSPFYYGWDDPFWYGGYGGYGGRGGVDSYVEYHSDLDLHIRSRGSNAPLFDGRAQARSQTDRLDVVIPSLVEAMFTNFPGRNGETVKITIPTKPRS